MKKFSKYLILCFIMCLCLCGCNNDKKDIKQDDKKEESKFVDLGSGIKKYDLKCEEIQDIIDYSFYNSLFITNDGKLYQISFDKIFSNEKNCKQIDSSNTFKKFIRGGILDSQNDIYYFNTNEILERYDFSGGNTIMPSLQNVDKNNYINISSSFAMNDPQNFKYFLISNNKVYEYKNGYNESTLIQEPIFVTSDDETIEYFIDGTIKTNKSFYTYSSKVKNKKECSKYADVECINEDGFFEVNKKIASQYNNIKFYKYSGYSDIVVDINNNVYTNVLGG